MSKTVITTLIFLLAAGVFLGVISITSQAAPINETVIDATEDAYIYLSEPDTAHEGVALTLEYQPTPGPGTVRAVLIKFPIDLANPIVEAHLDLFATACGGYLPFSAQNVAIYTVDDDSWTESTVTWANAPAKGSFMLSIDGGTATIDAYNQWTDASNGSLAQYLEAQNISSGGDGEASFWLEISGASANTQLSFMDKDGALGACGAAGANRSLWGGRRKPTTALYF